MSFYPELDGLGLEALIAVFRAPYPDDDALTWYQEVGYQIGQQGPAGVSALLAEAARTDESRLAGILLGCSAGAPANPAVPALLRASLADDRPWVLQQAIDGLSLIRDVAAREMVRPFFGHTSPYVVGATLRYLAGLFPDETRPLLLDALTDARYIVRENAVDELDEMDHEAVAQWIFPLLADPHQHVRWAAQTFLDHWWWTDGRSEPADQLAIPDPLVRASALYTAVDRDPELSLPWMLAALDDPAPVVRVAALDALANQWWIGAEIRTALIERVEALQQDPEPLVSQAATRAIERERP